MAKKRKKEEEKEELSLDKEGLEEALKANPREETSEKTLGVIDEGSTDLSVSQTTAPVLEQTGVSQTLEQEVSDVPLNNNDEEEDKKVNITYDAPPSTENAQEYAGTTEQGGYDSQTQGLEVGNIIRDVREQPSTQPLGSQTPSQAGTMGTMEQDAFYINPQEHKQENKRPF